MSLFGKPDSLLKQIAIAFNDRMIRDNCQPYIQYSAPTGTGNITQFTVMCANNNNCDVEIPVTLPGRVVDTMGARTEQIGTDKPTLWVKLDGMPQTFTLSVSLPIS